MLSHTILSRYFFVFYAVKDKYGEEDDSEDSSSSESEDEDAEVRKWKNPQRIGNHKEYIVCIQLL